MNATTAVLVFLLSAVGFSHDTQIDRTTGSQPEPPVRAVFETEVDQDFKRFEFKSAIVELVREVVQAGVKITEKIILYIDDYGAREARFIEVKRVITMLDNREEISKKHTTMDPEYLISHTIGEPVAHRTPNLASAMMKNMNDAAALDFSQNIQKAMGAESKMAPPQTIGGVKCNCRTTTAQIGTMTSSTEECSYKNFIFLSISKVMGSDIVERVTSFKEGVEIPDEVWKFDVPVEDVKGMKFKN